jgi:hypothetical protein
MLVARYMIEDNNQDWLMIDESATNSVKIIKSVFKTLIKPYRLFDEKETRSIIGEFN